MANIKVNIDVESGEVVIASKNTLTLTQQVKILRQELQKVPEGTKEWTLLQAKFNETKDSLDRVNVKSKELFGTLGTLPGQFGSIAGQADNTIGVLKTFSKITFTDLGTQVLALGDDFLAIIKNLGTLTGVTKVYTVVLNAMTTAETVATTATKVFAATIAGLYAILGAGILYGLYQLATSFDKAGEAAVKAQEKFQNAFDVDAANRKQQFELADDLNKRLGVSDKIRTVNKIDYINGEIKAIEELNKSNEKFLKAELEADKKRSFAIDFGVFTGNQLEIQKKYDEKRLKNKADTDKLILLREQTTTDEVVQVREKAQTKAEQAAKEAQSLRDKDLAQIKANAKAASYAILEGRTKDLKEVNDKYNEQIALAKKYGKDTTELEEAFRIERKRINAKYDEDEAKVAAEFAKKLGAIAIESIQNDLQQKKAAREEKYSQDLRDLEADKSFIKLTEDAKNFYRQQLRQAADQDIVALEDKASQEIFDRKLKALQVENEGLVKGTQSYFDTKREIVNVSEQNELNDLRISLNQKNLTTEEFERQRANIIAKYAQQRKDIGLEELNAYLGYTTAILGAINGIFSMASDNLKLEQDRDIANAKGNKDKIEEIKKKGFEDNKKIQIAQAIIGTLQSAVQSFQSLSVIPIVGPALGAAAAAAALVFGYKQVALIKQQTYQSDSSSSGATSGAGTSSVSSPAFATPTIGAPQIGPTGAQTGVIAGTVAGAIGANQSSSQPLRAYVVGNDITTEMQLQRRLRTMARLGG